MDFCQLVFISGLSTFHVLHHQLLILFLRMIVDMIVNKFFSCKKKKKERKMIQIVCCSCTQKKLREDKVPFYVEKRFYDNIDKVFFAPCPRHPYFKERIGSQIAGIPCNCLNLDKGRCYNCKVICFNINFLAAKVKVGDVPSTVDIVPIETYLASIKSMLFFYFCRGSFKVHCS